MTDGGLGSCQVAVFADFFPPAFRGGGPIRTLEALVASAPQQFSVSVLTSDRDLNSIERLPVASNEWTKSGKASVYYASIDKPVKLVQALYRLRRERPQILYLNSFFSPRLSVLPQLLSGFFFWGRSSRLVAPRGEFGNGALQRRWFKKKAFILAYRLLRLDRNVYWHASSKDEAANIKSVWGSSARILIREDETSLPSTASPVSATRHESIGLRAVFLSRLVEHKGLLILLKALSKVTAHVTLDIYGPEEDKSHVAQCQLVADQLPNHINVRFFGVIPQETVRTTLGLYDVLLMPTAGENFSHVIAESLSVSCPVMCTPDTLWTTVLNNGGGYVVEDRSIAAWSQAVNKYAELPAKELVVRREQAEQAYARWKATSDGPHIFELLEGELSLHRRHIAGKA